MNGKLKLYPRLPLLEYFIESKKREKMNILDDKCIVLCLHFLRDLLPFVNGLKNLGLKPENCWLLAKPYPYPYKKLIEEELRNQGFRNIRIALHYPISGLCHEVLHEAYRYCINNDLKMIICEDGGHFCEQISSLPSYDRILGAVEQTTKGIRKYMYLKEQGKLKFPVLSVASSQFKHEYEPRFIAAAVTGNIRRFLPNMHLAGKKALIFGYGSIGEMIAHRLRVIENMRVDVCEKDSKRRLLALMDGFDAKKDIAEFNDRDWVLVVGCTGGSEKDGKTIPTIDENVISYLQSGCILVSASSDQVEIDITCLQQISEGNYEDVYIKENAERIKVGTKYKLTLMQRTLSPPEIYLLADGYPINFYNTESVPNESIDPILTLLFLCVLDIARNGKTLPNDILEEEVDKIIERERLIDNFMRIHGVR